MRGSKTFSSNDQPADNWALFNITRYRKWAKFLIVRTIGDSLNFEKKLFAIDTVRVVYVHFYLILFALIRLKKMNNFGHFLYWVMLNGA